MFASWYGRLGARYPRLVLATALRVEYVIVVAGTGGLALYVQMTTGQLALLAITAVAGQEVYALLTLRYFRPRLEVVARWIEGERSGDAATNAWRAGASAPYQLLRLWWRGGYPIVAGLAWCLFVTWLLGLEAWAIPALFLAAIVVFAFAHGIAFLVFERAMQPVLDDIALQISDEVEIDAISLPLRRRSVSAVPAISACVGVLVVGLVEDGHPGLGELMLAVAVSLGVAMTLALAFTILLRRFGGLADPPPRAGHGQGRWGRPGHAPPGELGRRDRHPHPRFQPDGLRSSGARAAARGLRHLRRPRPRRPGRPRRHRSARGGARGLDPVHGRARLYCVLGDGPRTRSRRPPQRALRDRRAGDHRQRWSREQVHRRRPARGLRGTRAPRRSRRARRGGSARDRRAGARSLRRRPGGGRWRELRRGRRRNDRRRRPPRLHGDRGRRKHGRPGRVGDPEDRGRRADHQRDQAPVEGRR